MILSTPVPFTEALQAHEVRSLLLTTGRSDQLAKMDTAVKQRAIWSATLNLADPLIKIRDGVDAMLAGVTDQATVRLGIKELYDQIGFVPDPSLAGGLRDLTSTARINLQLETLTATAQGAGWDLQGQQPDVLDEWPAQELLRDFGTHHPRGSSDRPGDLSWPERFVKAGGTLINGRMVALKSDPVWTRLGDPSLFPDGLGNPWAPFAYSSGMGLHDIGRDDAEQLGLIAANETVFPRSSSVEQDLAKSPEIRDAALRSVLADSGLGSFEGDVFVFSGGGP